MKHKIAFVFFPHAENRFEYTLLDEYSTQRLLQGIRRGILGGVWDYLGLYLGVVLDGF